MSVGTASKVKERCICKDSSGLYTEEALTVLQDIEDVLRPLTEKWLANGMSIDQISFLTTQTVNSLALDVVIRLNNEFINNESINTNE